MELGPMHPPGTFECAGRYGLLLFNNSSTHHDSMLCPPFVSTKLDQHSQIPRSWMSESGSVLLAACRYGQHQT